MNAPIATDLVVLHNGQDRDAWIKARDQGIGASEVPILFDCGYAESSKLDLYARKLGVEGLPAFKESEEIEAGRDFEDANIRRLAVRAELGEVDDGWAPNKCLLGNADFPHLIATPDGITCASEPIEVKNIGHMPHREEWEDGEIPRKFLIQVQSQIAVMGASRGLFGARLFGVKLVWNWYQRDDLLISEIRKRVIDFWHLIESRTPPESNGSETAHDAAFAVAATIPPKELFHGEIQQYLDTWEQGKLDEKRLNKLLKEAKASRKAAEDALTLKMGSAKTAVTSTGWAFEKVKSSRDGYYVKPSSSEKLDITAPKGTR
jgi:predicted phage-related endonuclease